VAYHNHGTQGLRSHSGSGSGIVLGGVKLLDANSEFFVGSTESHAESVRAAIEALQQEPTLRPDMFQTLYRLARGQN
jgi:hypothetical protein